MKIKSVVVTGLIASLALFAAVAFAQQSGSPQSDPSMQQSQSESQQQQQAVSKDPEAVKQVQQALNSQGYDSGPVDGIMGSKTESALKKFQQAQGMQATGKLDQQTMASLGVEGAAAGGQEGSMPDQQSGAGGQQESMPDQQSGAGGQQESMPDQQSGAGGQQESMPEQQSGAGGQQEESK